MMAADYRHIGGRENRLGRHYSRFSPFWPTPALSGQSLALRKLCDAGSNRRSQANENNRAWIVVVLLFIFMVINFADKAVIGIAAVPIMRELELDPRQFGLVGSS